MQKDYILNFLNNIEIDYNKIWKESHCFALSAQDKEKTKNMSKNEAASYAASAHVWEDGKIRAKGIKVKPDETVLEIGSGPGIISFELAAKAKHLTAIEPSLGMIEFFKDEAEKRNIKNTDTIQSFWEDYKIEKKYDVVVSSLSLITDDIFLFLKKMDEAAKRRVYIHWFASESTWEKQGRLVSEITGQPNSVRLPKINIVFNILYGMNIFPEIRLLNSTSFNRIYDSKDEALKALKKIYSVDTDKYDKELLDYIERDYEYKDSKYIYYDKTKFAELMWKKDF